ncbi:MAG: hypothetical protein V2A73_07525, partial [Pseudomonadota bacterium]
MIVRFGARFGVRFGRAIVTTSAPDPALARLKTTPPPLDLGAAASPRRPPSEETSDGSSLS